MTPDRRLCMMIAALGLAVFAGGAWGVEQQAQLQTKTGTLHGTLDLPGGTPPFPVVVIIAGSGPTDRDGNNPQLKNDHLKLLGHALAAKGIAALRYDKRGIAQSAAAAPREEDLRFEMLAADVVQWVASLRRDPRFSRIGILGHSEGSLVGILAAKQAQVDAFVSVAGAGRPAPAVLREQLANLPENLKAVSDRILDELVAGRSVASVPEDLAVFYRPSVQPYLISWFKYDPARELGGLGAPALIVQGTTDLQVGVQDATRLAAAKSDATFRLIQGMNHVLKRARTIEEQNQAYTNPSLPIEPRAVEEIANFLNAKMGQQHPHVKGANE